MLKIALLSNINIDSFQFKLKKDNSLFFPKGYNTWQNELMDDSSDFYAFQANCCFLIFDGIGFFETIQNDIQNNIEELFVCIEYALKKAPQCNFFISDLDVYSLSVSDSKNISETAYFEYIWAKRLKDCLNTFSNAYFFPLKDIVLHYGRDTVYSSKMWYLASNRFSVSGVNIITEQIKKYIRPLLIPQKKCLALDLDNTLWGGVISENGIDGIVLNNYGEGARFYDFQKIIKAIQKRGILLAVLSKNNMDDAEKAFTHPQMLLKQNDFAAMAVNWDRKSDNIAKIAKELNIGLADFVFIDDNPVEREEMKLNQPEVIVVDFPEDTSRLAQFAIEIYNQYFLTLSLSQEDEIKTRMYSENKLRETKKNEFLSIEDFLIDMDIKLSVMKVTAEDVIRSAQMTQKTNQFNLTTKRYSESDITNMINDENILLLIGHVQDKYGDNGNSILSIVRFVSPCIAEIDTFLMSCRIMNRTVEFGFLYEIEKILKEKGIKTICAQYIKTGKNSPACLFFDSAGYNIVSETDSKKSYELIINTEIEKTKKCYATVKRRF
jgi:FkbH-like protein